MKKISTKIIRCQFSKKKDLELVLSLGSLPAVNNFEKIKKKKAHEFFFPTNLVYSKSSNLFQIDNVVEKEILFPKTYPYTSSTTKILRNNFSSLFKEVKKVIDLKPKDLVVDIGSNDGNLLRQFKNVRVLGVTPEDIGKKAIKSGIPTILSYFNKDVVNKILKKYGKAKIVTATNVFAHMENLNEVTDNIMKIMDKDGMFITESHYFLSILQNLQYDTIYHEHLRYYTLTSLKKFLEKKHLKIFNFVKIPTHGGSIRVYASKNKNVKVSKNIRKILSYEKRVINKHNLKKFSVKVLDTKIKLLNLLNKIKTKNQIVYGVGAPSRAATLINYTGINHNLLKCICEISGSHKIGKFMPGTNIPILNEKIIFKKKPDYLLILSWHIFEDLKRVFKQKGYKGKFILPLPSPKIVN